MNRKNPLSKYSILITTLFLGLALSLALPWLDNAQGAAAEIELVKPNAPDAGIKYHVSKTGDGSDGLNWTRAFTNVQDALVVAVPPAEIWVAKGVYYPDVGSGQTNNALTSTFILTDGVALIGGFKVGDTDISDQDPQVNVTVLSGDIDWDNGGVDNTDTNGVVITAADIIGANAYHVVSAEGVTGTALLDGFTITAGKADGASYPHGLGGGLYCDGLGDGNFCSPSLKNVIFSGNLADEGGAMSNIGTLGGSSSPNLTNVTFSGNHADGSGGAMVNTGDEGGESSPELTNVTFSGNSAGSVAGAMYNSSSENGSSSPILTNVTFSGNRADQTGGAMLNYGSKNGNTSPILTNVTFSGNLAEECGAMFNSGFNGTSAPVVRNSIFWNNKDNYGNQPFCNNDAVITLSNSLFQDSFPSGGYVDGSGNIDTDPLFVTPIDPSTAPTILGDLRLKINSPAINAGNNDYVTVSFDLDGNDRIIAGTVDMGAYENQNKYPFENYMPLIKR